MIKVIGISTSPRKDKNTDFAVKQVLSSIKEQSDQVETEFIGLSKRSILPCISCDFCKKNFSCSQNDDFNDLLAVLKDPAVKGIVLGTPVYMGGMNGQAKCLIDRSVVLRRNGFSLAGKIGAALAVGGSRNGGQELAVRDVQTGFLLHNMIIIPDSQPTAHFGGTGWERVPGGIEQDPDSLNTFKNLGINMANILNKLEN